MKIQYKILYLLIGIFVIYTLLFCGFIYYSISNYAFTDFYKRLEIRAAVIAKVKLEEHSDVTILRQMGQEYLEILPNQADYIIPIQNGKVHNSTAEKSLSPSLLSDIIDKGNGNYSKGKIFYSGIKYKTAKGLEYAVIVSAENYFYTHHIAYLRNMLFGSLAFGILWIIFFSFLVSRTLIKPIKNIIKDVNNIGSENLNLRLQMPQTNDQLSVLIETFNDMLTRLETSFETQKNFVSNASHELNTPLTSIIGEADLALSKDRDSAEYREVLNKIMTEAEKLDKKIKALLFLAQTGYNGKAQKFDTVRVDQLVLDVKDTVQRINTASRIVIDFSLLPENHLKLKTLGNTQLLHLALSNVVVNACKYSDGKPVHIALGASDTEIVIIVRDQGIGIPENELQYVYDPYFRASNTGNYEGYGIGLPLSRNIFKLHHGSMRITSSTETGTTVQIHLPIKQNHVA